MGTELRALGQDAADLGLRLAAAAARVLDASRRDAREIERISIERRELGDALKAELVRSGALAKRVDASESKLAATHRLLNLANARAEGIAQYADDRVLGAVEEEESLRSLYEAKCEEADDLAARLDKLAGGDIKDQDALDRMGTLMAEAERRRDAAVETERSALTDLAKLRSCFEAQRLALCDRLGLDDNATWADITQRVR
jgi:hypothetical protein